MPVFVLKALGSILVQDYENFELIVLDNTCTAPSRPLLQTGILKPCFRSKLRARMHGAAPGAPLEAPGFLRRADL
jgi:hypothetical protein